MSKIESKDCLKEFIWYASLNVLGMIGLSCYILADTFFVAKGLGSNGLAALNLAIPVYSFIHGTGLMLGMGGATRYSILKSQKRSREGNAAFSHTMILGLLAAALFLGAGLFLAELITTWLGADAAVFSMCRTYLTVLLLFSPIFLLNDMMLCFVRNDGAPQLAMAAMLIGSLSNIVLDYIFIFPCRMGIFGAVLATGFAPIISLLIQSSFFLKKKNQFHMVRFRPTIGTVRTILVTGVPSLVTELSSGIVMIVFNAIILGLSGNSGVAAYGVIANLSLVVIAVYTGIAQGCQPLISKYFGLGRREHIRALLRYALLTVTAISLVLYACVFLGAQGITALFNSEQDAVLAAIAVPGLRIYFTGCIFAGLNIVLCSYFSSSDRARPANILSLLRGFFVIIPAAFLLSELFALAGLWAAFPVTEALVAGVGMVFYRKCRRPE